MRQAAVAIRVELHALAQHGWIVLRLRRLHQRGQREHAHAAGNGEEGDNGGECVHEGRSIKGTLQPEPDPASTMKHYYKTGRNKKGHRSALIPGIQALLMQTLATPWPRLAI